MHGRYSINDGHHYGHLQPRVEELSEIVRVKHRTVPDAEEVLSKYPVNK